MDFDGSIVPVLALGSAASPSCDQIKIACPISAASSSFGSQVAGLPLFRSGRRRRRRGRRRRQGGGEEGQRQQRQPCLPQARVRWKGTEGLWMRFSSGAGSPAAFYQHAEWCPTASSLPTRSSRLLSPAPSSKPSSKLRNAWEDYLARPAATRHITRSFAVCIPVAHRSMGSVFHSQNHYQGLFGPLLLDGMSE